MKVRRRREIVRKGKAALALRRGVGWTRADWVIAVESMLVEAFLVFAEAKLAGRSGRRRKARALTAEFDRRLFVRMIGIHVHPLKQTFDRAQAFEEAVSEMTGSSIPALRAHVERELTKVHAVRRGLDDRDLEQFWAKVREASRVLTGKI